MCFTVANAALIIFSTVMSPEHKKHQTTNMSRPNGKEKGETPEELFTFRGDHYNAWCVFMESKLGKKDLLDFIGEEAAKGGIYEWGGGTDEVEKKRIKRGHIMAVSFLKSYLSLDLIKVHVGTTQNAYAVWKSLKTTYDQNNIENAMTYKMKLEELKFSDFKDITSYLSAFDARVSKLTLACGFRTENL